jgi:hypothetical protein
MIGGRDVSEMARWWSKQSFAGDKGGSFNFALYLEYLKCKNSCIDYCTTMKKGSQRATISQPKPYAIGNLTNLEQQVLTFTDTL